MRDKIRFDKILLNRIIKANYRLSKIDFAETWGTKEDIVGRRKKSDKVVMKIASLSNRYKGYGLSL